MRRFTISGSRPTSNPATVPRPLVGLRMPESMRMSVDFPAPFAPRRPMISPGGTANVTSATARKEPKVLESLSAVRAYSAAAAFTFPVTLFRPPRSR